MKTRAEQSRRVRCREKVEQNRAMKYIAEQCNRGRSKERRGDSRERTEEIDVDGSKTDESEDEIDKEERSAGEQTALGR